MSNDTNTLLKIILTRIAALLVLLNIAYPKLKAQDNQEEFILDKIQPGISSRIDMYALFGEPESTKLLENVKVEKFITKDKFFKHVVLYFNTTDILGWAQLQPIHLISAEDAPLLFLVISEPKTNAGNSFDDEKGTIGETHHYIDKGVHFYIHEGKVEEIWLTQPESNLENIQAILSQNFSDDLSQIDNNTMNKDVGTPDEIAQPEIIFEDDFNDENNGRGTLNYGRLERWDVTYGKVDLIGNGFWDIHPDYGLHLDMDGSGNMAGTILTKEEFSLSPGSYSLEFDLAGNFQRTTNTVKVSLGNIFREEFTLEAKETFRKIKREIQVTELTNAKLEFRHEGGDNFGILLDNIRLFKNFKNNSDINNSKYSDGELITYIGVAFDRHNGEGIKILGVLDDMPAQNAGLQKGDVILEIENISFRDLGSKPEQFSEKIKGLPINTPLRFLIERKGKKFDVWVKPARITEEQRNNFQTKIQERFGSDYSKGKRLMINNDYAGAVGFFQKSLKSHPMLSYQGLGICFYHLGKYNEAKESIKEAIKLDKKQPLSWFYGGLNMEALNKRNGAIDAYQEYLKMNHNNAEMNAYAQDRIKALKEESKNELKMKLFKMIDAIRKEINN